MRKKQTTQIGAHCLLLYSSNFKNVSLEVTDRDLFLHSLPPALCTCGPSVQCTLARIKHIVIGHPARSLAINSTFTARCFHPDGMKRV